VMFDSTNNKSVRRKCAASSLVPVVQHSKSAEIACRRIAATLFTMIRAPRHGLSVTVKTSIISCGLDRYIGKCPTLLVFLHVQVPSHEKNAYRTLVHINLEKFCSNKQKANTIVLAIQKKSTADVYTWRSQVVRMSTEWGERPYFGRDEAGEFRRR